MNAKSGKPRKDVEEIELADWEDEALDAAWDSIEKSDSEETPKGREQKDGSLIERLHRLWHNRSE